MCKKLSQDGFKVCMISRNEEKMKEKMKGINGTYIVADFSKMFTIKDYKVISDQLKDKDVGILCLNAGVQQMGAFSELTDQEIQDIVSVNALHVVYFAKLMIAQLSQRKKRSAIIVTSSGFGAKCYAGTIAYSAAKSFASFIAEGLNYELSE
jgi:short-subunit dehydrogenase